MSLYIGNEAHRLIARHCRNAHEGDEVYVNATPIQSILAKLRDNGAAVTDTALTAEQMLLRPDIVNITRMHIYEIKPASAAWAGSAQVALYTGIFARSGVMMALGPSTEPGTSGALPAPGGVFIFGSPEPGVIVYQYRRARLVRVRKPAPARAEARAAQWSWEWELEPLTREQREQVMTATAGTVMIMLMTLLLLPVSS